MKSQLKTLVIAAAAAIGVSMGAPEARAMEKNIVETAAEAGKFGTLTKALGAAGLVETLKGKGPFTVFAPTDEAFAKLPAGTLESLLKPENKDQLTAILTYHVVPGKLEAASLDQVYFSRVFADIHAEIVDPPTRRAFIAIRADAEAELHRLAAQEVQRVAL